MSRYESPSAEFARRGFDSAASAARVWERWESDYGRDLPIDLRLFERVADRDQALEALERLWHADPQLFGRIVSDESWLLRVLLVLGGSTALAQTLTRHPEEALCLEHAPEARGADGWRAFVEDRVAPVGGVAEGNGDALRLANRVALIEIACRDLAAENPVDLVHDIAAELSHVADAVLEMSLAYARAEVPGWEKTRLAVLAMGKTGAQELNYISDVDVVYVAEPADGVGADEAVAIGSRIAAAQARICSAHTAEGTIWQVDAALRPEGKAGPLVRTLDSCRAYYEKWAKNWEFQAMLKARPAAGDLALGEAFVELISPLVWCAGERPGFLSEVRAMRARVISLLPARQADAEIKLGEGGLRDTEFSVQLLQLVHGRADDRLRSRGTFRALHELVDDGYIGRADGAEMETAYRFQRLLEHRVQLRRLRRTHLVPDEPLAREQIARSMGLRAEQLIDTWRSSTRQVRALQQRIFFSPLLDAVSKVSTEGLRLTSDAAAARLRALGFLDPRTALGHLEALTRGTSRSAEIQRQLLPAMLEWFAEGPNPDFGLLAFRQLSEALRDTTWYLRALRDDANMAHRLARIASSSRFVVDLLRRAPDMIRMLASNEELRPRSAEELTAAMRAASARNDDAEAAAASVRALRRSELCRVALADVLGLADVEVVGEALSDLAAATLDAGLDLARRSVDAPDIGVVALGRWGGRELSYASDADCVFIVPDGTDDQGQARATELVRLACDIVGRPGPDPALVVDTELRPEGKGGPQVRTVSSYLAYYDRWASTWERQMLVRARAGAGGLALAHALLDGVDGFRWPDGGLTEAQVTEIRRLKSRMEHERIPKGVPRERHLKLGPGGLSDVEWTVQLLQLRHAHAHPELRTPSTMRALACLDRLGLVDDTQAERLSQAWRRASRLRNAIMLVRGRASDALPSDTRDLAQISVLLGYESGAASGMVDDTRRLMRHALDVTNQLFWT